MEKFEEYFRTTKHYENMLLDIARNQLSVSVFDKNGRKYRNHIVQTAYEVFQHQQAKVEELQTQLSLQRQRVKAFEEELTSSRNYGDELQKRVDAYQNLLSKWKSAHLKGSSDYARGGFHARQDCEDELEQALKGEGQ